MPLYQPRAFPMHVPGGVVKGILGNIDCKFPRINKSKLLKCETGTLIVQMRTMRYDQLSTAVAMVTAGK